MFFYYGDISERLGINGTYGGIVRCVVHIDCSAYSIQSLLTSNLCQFYDLTGEH